MIKTALACALLVMTGSHEEGRQLVCNPLPNGDLECEVLEGGGSPSPKRAQCGEFKGGTRWCEV